MKKLSEILKKRVDILKTTELLNDDSIDKKKLETKLYNCETINSDVNLYLIVVSPDLLVTNTAFINNNDEIDVAKNPINIGKSDALKKKRLVVYSVATSRSDNVKYTLNVELRRNGKKQSFSTTLSLSKDETGEIIQDINFV